MSTTDITGFSSAPPSPRCRSLATPSEIHGGQMFFEFDAPEAFVSPQLFAVNPSGNVSSLQIVDVINTECLNARCR
ncbi:unnamed protein product [Strongylus vulgaris]|uniref:Uncharacterized protein n=1 Tax=Strongylus vulgaris TaxID=40348 RepID=A0A3P7LBX7_STRVU|nr:unnamed protein product [Strongylus vulgaris]